MKAMFVNGESVIDARTGRSGRIVGILTFSNEVLEVPPYDYTVFMDGASEPEMVSERYLCKASFLTMKFIQFLIEVSRYDRSGNDYK